MRFTPKQRLFEEFRLLSTLKRPKMLIEATEYDACFVSVFKSRCFYLSTLVKECFQNAPFSEAFSKASFFISVFCRFNVDVRRSMCFQMNPDLPLSGVRVWDYVCGPLQFHRLPKMIFLPFFSASFYRKIHERTHQTKSPGEHRTRWPRLKPARGLSLWTYLDTEWMELLANEPLQRTLSEPTRLEKRMSDS